MHVTVDDVNFCDGLECVYVKYKSCVSTVVNCLIKYMGFCGLKQLLITCDTAFYAIIKIDSCCLSTW